ncbi:hypothetical protein DSO57_1015623 [Entomophthora muscae]|uniref:Uncharacterized protein n=1 Tax=Entomophthora muscae TaxID=34485 RepID=A0ACC2T5A4_9FUNG|nr:hypothetical protein DSO57_1015623 [Entomophthora muscae]
MNLWFKKILPYLVLVIFHLNSSQVDNQAAAPSRDQPAKPPQALYRPPGAPFGPVHFTEYPPNLAYLEYNLRKGKRIELPPLLFKDKYNYLPAYFVSMTPPLTPKPDHPLEPPTAAKTTSTQLFGVLYITLTGLVDFMVPNSGPWSLLGQFVSYIIKLAPILWWALPAGLVTPHPEPLNAETYDWIPDIIWLFQSISFSLGGNSISDNPTADSTLKAFTNQDAGLINLNPTSFHVLNH